MDEIPEITGMRGYASIGVVVFHLFTLSSYLRSLPVPAIVLSWNSGVDFFFVLSGFLLSVPFMQGKVGLKVYFVKRIFRIMPVYYLSIIMCGGTLVAINYATVQQLLTSLVFAQSLSPSTFNSINGVTWTLVIEEVFYVTLPLFSLLFIKGRWRYALPLCITFSMAYRVWVGVSYPTQDLAFHLWQYPSFVGHYAVGVTLAGFYANGQMRPAKFYSSLPLVAVVVTLLSTQMVVGSWFSVGNNLVPFPGMVFAIEYGALIYFVLTSPVTSAIRLAFTNRAATITGKMSYSMYTWHLPIEVALLQVGLPPLTWAATSLSLALLVAFVSFRKLELPFLELRNNFLMARGWSRIPVTGRGNPI